ncbi:hypothetical protein COSO111634_15650 [Corallococcus soli]
MMTSAIRNSVNDPFADVSCTMAMVTVGENDTTTVDISALTASACGTVMGWRNGSRGLSANVAAKHTANVTPQTVAQRMATRAPTRRSRPRCSSVPATSAMRLTASPFTSSSPFTPAFGMKPSAYGPTATPTSR